MSLMEKVKSEWYNELIDYIDQAYIWAETDSVLKYVVEQNINDIIAKIQADNKLMIDEKLKIFSQRIENEIAKFLFTYNEEELVIALLVLKARFRCAISSSENVQSDYEMVNRHSEILQLIKMLLRNTNKCFKGNSIINGTKNLAMSFRYAYYYNVVMNNIEMYNSQKSKIDFYFSLYDVIKEGFFYTEEYNDFMDSMLRISEEVIPEESEIQTQELKDYLREKKYDIQAIKDEISESIYINLGFTFEHLNNFCFKGNEDSSNIVYIEVNECKKHITKFFPDQKINFDNIISLFSLNKIHGEDINISNIELRSIYLMEDTLIFHPLDLCWNISCFEKFLMRNQYTEMYFKLLDSSNIEKLKQELRKIESKISTYLAYIISEQMFLNGYIVPTKDDIPQAEITCLLKQENGKSINLLHSDKNYGDIDVLALDKYKKQIYNIEIKFFKPLIWPLNIDDKYKISDREKYIQRALLRKNIIENNLSTVLSILGEKEISNYNIRTIILSPRPDYWLQKYDSVEYFDWVDFLGRIRSRNL